MRKFLLLFLWLLLPSLAAADALPMGGDLSGVLVYPWDATETTATYVYRYAYPQVAGDDEVAQMINNTYAYEVSYAEEFTVPMTGDMLGSGRLQFQTLVSYDITCNNDEYFCVVLRSERMEGAAFSTQLSAHTFARHGARAGRILSLPYLLGVLDADEEDPWLQERQTAKCDACVRDLIWEIIEEQRLLGEVAYYDDLTRETFDMWFWPEEDFYLEQDGTLVFFIQEAAIAPQSEGILTFRFAPEEILDEL